MSDYRNCKVITTESYYEKLAHRHIEVEQHVEVDQSNILSEFIKCLDLAKKSDKVRIDIKSKHGQPFMLVKQWTESKEDLGRR